MPITIVGLGPGDAGLITRQAWDVLADATEIVLRTARHPAAAALPPGAAIRALDDFYQAHADFDEVYDAIAAEIVRLGARPQGVVYAVPGHPLVGEDTVKRILARAAESNLPVEIVAGLSFVEPMLSALGIDALDGLQVVDGITLGAAHHPPLNTDTPTLVAQVYSREVASDVKLTLMNAYPPAHPVTLVQGAGAWGTALETVALAELDHDRDLWQAAPHLTSLYVPPLPAPGSFESFAQTVARLRAPGGCPWDQEQTHQSLRSELLEETYEVLAALDADDPDALREELGDLLLNVLMQAQIAVEGGEFSISEVIAYVDAKIKRRHPHVFGDAVVKDVDELLANWERIKAAERSEKAQQDGTAGAAKATEGHSMLDGLPVTLPALSQAQAYQKRAARVGFDWKDLSGVVDKVCEEVAEIRSARGAARRAAEIGDLLFSVVNYARWLKVDAETALRESNLRFSRRFRALEDAAVAQGRTLKELSPEESDALWEKIKRREKRRPPKS